MIVSLANQLIGNQNCSKGYKVFVFCNWWTVIVIETNDNEEAMFRTEAHFSCVKFKEVSVTIPHL